MAKKTTVKNEPAEDPVAASNLDLDNAIDDLRGALKADEQGTTLSDDFGGFASTGSSFGDFASSDFGADAFGSEGSTAGGMDFGSGSLGSDTFGDFSDTAPAMMGANHSSNGDTRGLEANHALIMDIPIEVQIVLGASRMPVKGLMNLKEGTTITLDKKIGEPVDIMVNGRLIGRGEITLLEHDDTRFGVKLTEICGAPKN
jgi:flagellar motor switch protein FliN/FliY